MHKKTPPPSPTQQQEGGGGLMHCDWGELSSILTLNQQVLALGSLIGSYYAMFFSLLVFRHPKAKTHIIPDLSCVTVGSDFWLPPDASASSERGAREISDWKRWPGTFGATRSLPQESSRGTWLARRHYRPRRQGLWRRQCRRSLCSGITRERR